MQFEPYPIDPRRNISLESFLVISHVQNFSGQTLVIFNLLVYLLGNSGLWIKIRIQYLSIWALTNLRPNMHEFWTSAPTDMIDIYKQTFFFFFLFSILKTNIVFFFFFVILTNTLKVMVKN